MRPPHAGFHSSGRCRLEHRVVRHTCADRRTVHDGKTLCPPRRNRRVVRNQCFLRSRRSEEHTSELQSLMRISYAVFCLKKKTKNKNPQICTTFHITQLAFLSLIAVKNSHLTT